MISDMIKSGSSMEEIDEDGMLIKLSEANESNAFQLGKN